jgi:Holliday junction DNA helicase RuvB
MSLGHILLSGSPGLGKTSLARLIAKELSVNIFELIGPRIESEEILDEVFSEINAGDVLFIDEIHALKPAVEELLYAAMEDYTWQGKKLPAFTLIGATTKVGSLSRPLHDRFTIAEHLVPYSLTELQLITIGSAGKLNHIIHSEAAAEIAKRSRGTPRLSNQYLLRVRDYATNSLITLADVETCFKALDIDSNGLDRQDRKLIATIHKLFRNRPVGIGSLSSALDEDRETIETLREPYLVNMGLLGRGSKGRFLTEEGIKLAGTLG